MLKRNLAVLVLVGALFGGGAYAWAQTNDTSPSAPTTAPSGQQAPAAQGKARRTGQAGGILRRVVHGDLVVRGKDGFQNVTYDRGTEDGVSDNTLTITRPDGKKVSVKLTSTTRYRGVKDASQLQTGKQTLVLSKDGNALMVGQRSGDNNGSAPGGQK
ncbi:MAG: hypothetical protein JO248_03500 [Acidimicrobiia bacterium]|nr:hypothetical protein [Acidimicrobiia bacterium]MBV8983489.1 hypothetical protein [Acidimicrobiia bacterium]